MASVQHAERSGFALERDETARKLETKRAQQARAICKKLGADLEQLDKAIEARVSEMDHGD